MSPRDATNFHQYYEIIWTNLELGAFGAFHGTGTDADDLGDEANHVHQADSEEDWFSGSPPTTPFVPTPEVLAWLDELCAILEQQQNLSTFGVAFPQEQHYEEFFKNFSTTRYYNYHFDDDDDDDYELESSISHFIL